MADPVVVRIGDVEVARLVHRHVIGVVELGRGGLTPVSAKAFRSRPRDGGARPRGVHLADPVVFRIGDVEVARPVHRQANRQVEQRSRSDAREGGDDP